MAKIIFFNDRNYQGQRHECNGDCRDLHTYLGRCNSIRVEGGCWVIYERPNFGGHQYVLMPGDYPNYKHWLGFSDTVRSCRIVRNVGNSWRLKVFERVNFEGQSVELTDDMPAFSERWHNREVHSCKAFEGAWVFYEHPDYSGRQYLVERGEYKCYAEWGAVRASVGSMRRVKAY